MTYRNLLFLLSEKIITVEDEQKEIDDLKKRIETLQKNMEVEAAATENFGLGRKN